MKITIVQGAFLPVPTARGGAVEKVWFGLGKEFVRRGHGVTHISRTFSGFPATETIEGVQHVRVPGYDTPAELWRLKLLDLRYSLAARKVLPSADILVTNTFWMPILVRSRKPGLVYVNVQRYPKGQMKFYRHVARLQAVSQATARAIVEQTPQCQHMVKVLPNQLDGRWFAPTQAERIINRVLFVGRIHPEKGLELLLNGMARANAVREIPLSLVVVGPWDVGAGGGGEEYKRQLDRLAEQLGLSVHWTGAIYDEAELIAQYDAADLFVYPSLAAKGETFGVAPLEGMARGCRTVVSGLECFQDFVCHGENAWVFNHEDADPAARLAEVLQHAAGAADADRVRCAGRDRAAEFRLESVAQRYLEDFESLLGGRS